MWPPLCWLCEERQGCQADQKRCVYCSVTSERRTCVPCSAYVDAHGRSEAGLLRESSRLCLLCAGSQILLLLLNWGGRGGGGRGKPKWKKETLLWKSAISTLNRAGQPQQCSWRVRLMQKTLISVEISPWTVVGFGSTPSSLFPSTGSSETIFWELWNK